MPHQAPLEAATGDEAQAVEARAKGMSPLRGLLGHWGQVWSDKDPSLSLTSNGYGLRGDGECLSAHRTAPKCITHS